MKKMILAVAALLMVGAASAQVPGFEWGVKGGLNLSNVTNSDGKMKPSIYVGAFAEFGVNDWLGIQPEVVYSRQGTADGDLKLRFNYLNIPVMAKFYVLDQLSVETGPQFGILLNAKMKNKVDGKNVTADVDGAKNFDVSWGIGASYRFLSNFDATLRYNIGLTKVFDTGTDTPKNGVLQLGVGYRF